MGDGVGDGSGPVLIVTKLRPPTVRVRSLRVSGFWSRFGPGRA